VSAGTGFAVALTVTAGLAGAVQVAVMGELGDRVGTLEAFAFAALLTAAVGLVLLLSARQSASGIGDVLHQPAWLWTGGLMGALVVLSITFAAPRIGAAATIGLVIAGNLIMGAAIDRFGLFGLDRIHLSGVRVLGIALLAAGAALSLYKR
jgi:bacterial/archaeal transporter family-2 protein